MKEGVGKAPLITQVVVKGDLHLGQLPINLQQLLVEMPPFALNPFVVPAQLGATSPLLADHFPSQHAHAAGFYILKQTPSAQVLCRLQPAGSSVSQPPFIFQPVLCIRRLGRKCVISMKADTAFFSIYTY